MAYQSKNPYTREVFASFDYVSDDELEKKITAERPGLLDLVPDFLCTAGCSRT